jgi:ubiquitin thioesterase OTU1
MQPVKKYLSCMLYLAGQVGGPEAEASSRGAEQLVAACHAARQFTDTQNFTLRCGICQMGVKGEKEAQEHAKQTGHTNFAEY